ncbi:MULTISPECIES: response regulator transcription factor [Caloramator]|uniref:Stage 0 sporulation protein A homolog n=1 Tax=Caloramator australicus RC3 TaxID=857293 RepID=I7J4L4_9CLOT|nr:MULTISPECIES: response regulator transcription factor [Caloramator]MDO6354157.1 response regulator transcription factor [Caloramator sp. CAR-1]CCJ32721.1 Two-component response regulator [Caloramator australicus RC3]
MKRVLIVEDHEEIRGFIKINLKREGYDVLEAEDGEKALDILKKNDGIDIAIVDLMLPKIDGFYVCNKIREKDPFIGIIILTARSQEADKIAGFSKGADDYVVKPFSPKELVARVDSLFRRVSMIRRNNNEIFMYPFKVDFNSRKFFKEDKEIELTYIEFELLKLFINNPNKAFKRDEILNIIWGEDYIGSYKIVDVNISRLRQKIEDDPTCPKYIKSIRGYGYRWEIK